MATTQDLLKKINYIEADIEIQKQILFATPTADRAEMEKTISLIAGKKQEIEGLREQIMQQDPDEHQRITRFEETSRAFQKLAEEKKFVSVSGGNPAEQCFLSLSDGSQCQCLVKACCGNGDWAIITLEGEIQHFTADQVAEVDDSQLE